MRDPGQFIGEVLLFDNTGRDSPMGSWQTCVRARTPVRALILTVKDSSLASQLPRWSSEQVSSSRLFLPATQTPATHCMQYMPSECVQNANQTQVYYLCSSNVTQSLRNSVLEGPCFCQLRHGSKHASHACECPGTSMELLHSCFQSQATCM